MGLTRRLGGRSTPQTIELLAEELVPLEVQYVKDWLPRQPPAKPAI